MEVLRVARPALAASSAPGSRPLRGAPRRLPPGAWRAAGSAPRLRRRLGDLPLTFCAAEKREEVLPPAFEEKDESEVLLPAEAPGSGPCFDEAPEVLGAEGSKGRMRSSTIAATVSEEKHENVGEEKQSRPVIRYNIIFVTAEAAPYSKTGGLGDVCGSLPIALAARGHRVMVVSPRYLDGVSDEKFANAVDTGCRIKISCFGGQQEVAFFQEYRAGVDWVFVDHLSYHRPGNPYGDVYGAYGDNQWVFPTWARTHALDPGKSVNLLKGAVVTVDRIVTVSQGYSWEITTPEGGYGLHELLNSRKSVLNGITNGIDVGDWDPASDQHIQFHYSVNDLSGKVKCKMALQEEFGLDVRPDCPLIGFIGRLDMQKGTDLIMMAMPELMKEDIQFVMLGSGDAGTEQWMRTAESIYRDKFRGWVGFNVAISHRITAGCDILLMPSRFEPCGLNQLYAMRYGTVPVVHATGGLKDTVENFNPYANEGSGKGTGWAFSPLSKDSMLKALNLAIRTYRDFKPSWEGLMKRGMSKDFTWDNAAAQYEQVFGWAFIDPPYVR
ncbi:hypothetical protein Taro_043611 [Colocasia esculenta]|uniref:Starch synthase, chloroplastic/amyloplastic n=1 Tax=Colocasia esculenta TaxID=4460 RepID=A0A843WW82_COLES|nr:hypothetical protein [Colocasia esculenta]